MTGTRIKGFLVGEWLGHGRAGALYLARHETTGQQAVVRLVRVNKPIELRYFLEEAQTLLPDAGELSVIEVTSTEGATVQFAVVPSAEPVVPPGISALRMTLVALLATVVVAGGSAVLWLGQKAPAPAAPVTVPTAGPINLTAPPEPAAVDSGEPHALEPVARPAELVQPAPRPLPKRSAPAPSRPPAPPCTFDDRFLGYARRTLSYLREMREPTRREFEILEDRLGDALVAKDCRKANQALDDLRRLVGAPVDD
jgi:hypothetical protein